MKINFMTKEQKAMTKILVAEAGARERLELATLAQKAVESGISSITAYYRMEKAWDAFVESNLRIGDKEAEEKAKELKSRITLKNKVKDWLAKDAVVVEEYVLLEEPKQVIHQSRGKIYIARAIRTNETIVHGAVEAYFVVWHLDDIFCKPSEVWPVKGFDSAYKNGIYSNIGWTATVDSDIRQKNIADFLYYANINKTRNN